jgi:hypothetical protein
MPIVTLLRKSLLLAFVAGLGSFSRGCIPDLETSSCAIQCDDSCPPELVCRQGFCVRPGFGGVCPSLLPPPNGQRWLGYIDEGPDGAVLRLLDPMVPPPGSTITLPREAEGSVRDFAFSPDGRWLALRLRDGADVDRLALFSAPSWDERELTLPGSVLQYAWSPTAPGTLAVALRDGEETFLSVVRTPTAADTPGTESALMMSPRVAAPIASALVWLEGERVVFHGPTEPGAVEDQRLYFAALGADGFGEVLPDIGMSFLIDGSGRLRLEPVPGGVAVVYTYPGSPNLMSAYALSSDGLRRVNHQPEVVLSPGGRHAARALDGVLQIFRTLEAQPDPDAPFYARAFATSDGCERLLAWSPDGARIACAAPATSQSRVLIFTLDSAAAMLLRTPVEGFYAYDQESAAFRRRAFSPGQSWFAFTNELNLYLADLTGTRLTVERGAQSLLSSDSAELSFSPDERFLLRQQGTSAWLLDLSVIQQASSLPRALESAAVCQETEGEAPVTWCGAPGSRTGLTWSSDSRFAAYVSAADQLAIVSSDGGQIFVSCATSCGKPVFQP